MTSGTIYECPQCGYRESAVIVIGQPTCPKCKIPLLKKKS